jgi:GNAT superfamily N-acetyltransferase
MNLIFRRSCSADFKQLWELHIHTVVSAGFPLAVAELDNDLRAIDTNYFEAGGCFLVGESSDGRILAMGGYVPTDKNSVELKRMRVHPDFQRLGLGEKLIQALESEAIQAGFSRAHLDTAHLKIKSFYEKNGYHLVKSEKDDVYEYFFYEKMLRSLSQC